MDGIPGAGALRACTFNAGGLSSPSKMAALLAFLDASAYSVAFVQETHLRDLPTDAHWRGSMHHSPGNGQTGGCLILLKPHPLLQRAAVVALPDAMATQGRVLRVDADVSGHAVSFLCVYAPATPAERTAFYTEVLPACLPAPGTREVILGGDLNCLVHPSDYCGPDPARGQARAAEVGARALAALMAGDSADHPALVDVWRASPQPRREATHFSAAHGTGARLDRWLLSPGAAAWAAQSSVLGFKPVASDHFPVALAIWPPAPALLGPGLHSMRVGLLDSEPAKQAIAAVVDAAVAAAAHPPEDAGPDFHRLNYLAMKQRVLAEARDLARAEDRQRRARSQRWHQDGVAARAHLIRAVTEGAPVDDVAAAATLLAASNAAAEDDFLQRAHHRRAVYEILDAAYDNRPTKYFFAKAAPPPPPVVVTSVCVEPGPLHLDLSTGAGAQAALHCAAARFSADEPGGVFAARHCDMAARQTLLAASTRGGGRGRLGPHHHR